MMMMMTEVAEQKRRTTVGFLGCHGGGGEAGNKRLKVGCSGGGAATRGGGEASMSVKEKKDKIGERVSALQQLVSPYGKSDTASVLLEATSYIKFLHEQLQVLSSPYIAPTGQLQGPEKQGLRSRGLCLMPVASTLRIARSNGADIWAPASANKA
uniref:Transcription factor bHLH113 n=1 Tax=Anthurium amnicola TaxID=1678845 RepID=A0A1D1YRL5_9ARAE